ncbi:MAG TPA: hypothetical protein PK325_00295 [Cyclobacteriaceae bacterium]|nr:hypothetical protein [Cyclobacteriaceae bacterium]HMV07667.1 hypothetical protein [Cyclobacteriaceae bacterium]HMV88468.1 hypothetical protein [Cyclobacteriaceae bacterium]HMW98802.1 hypothetical protein [Cyclobacteriaceae bacterium]HMX48565.1 hypothetical protein [Cyclobacteriaceae bacterium]
MTTFVRFIETCKQLSFLQVFTIYLRYLIGGAFVIAAFGMGKFSGQQLLISNPGASIETLEPLQQFFRVMATSGLYWEFIGLTQVIGGGLLMTQRFSKLGAVIFFGLILNIFIITVSYGFQGTPVVTGLMLLATVFLLLWDLNSFQFVLTAPRTETIVPANKLLIADHPFWTALGTLMLITIFTMAFLKFNLVVQLVSVFVEGLLAFIIFFSFRKRFQGLSAMV